MVVAASRSSRPLVGFLALAALLVATPLPAKKGGKAPPPSPQELYDQAMEKMVKKRYFQARTLLQQALPRVAPEDRELLPKVQLAIADAFFRDGGMLNYGESLNAYRNFLTYFPQHERAAYAQFMVGQSLFRQVLAPDRDQTMTFKAIDELRKVENAYPDSPYAGEARRTIEQCHDRLAERERLVGRYYQRRKSWLAAIDRYRAALEKYPNASNTSRLLYDLGTCLLTINQKEEAQEAFTKLEGTADAERYRPRVSAALRSYDRRREKEGEKFFGELSKEGQKKGSGS